MSVQARIKGLVEAYKGGTASPGPWTFYASLEDGMFSPINIDGKRWNKLYPYRLLVWDLDEEKIFGEGVQLPTLLPKATPDGYRIEFKPMANAWEFRLPITPQQYSTSTVFTTATTATQRGIVEEHGGIKFKIINCSGSFGVFPNRVNINKAPNSSALNTLFSGTIEAAGNLGRQLNRLGNSAFSDHPAAKPTNGDPKGPGLEGTGYYQMMLLDQFLEQYSELKKLEVAKNLRLVFDIPKENQSFIVTPIQFSYSKSADSPNEIRFSLQLKAWKRIKLNRSVDAAQFPGLGIGTDFITRLIRTTEEARRAAASYYNLIKAVRSDFQGVFNTLREISLFAKDLAGIPAAVIDLPRQVIQDGKSSISQVIANFESAGEQLSLPYLTGKVSETVKEIKSLYRDREGLSQNAVVSGQLDINAKNSLRTDPTNVIFETPEQSPAFDILNGLTADQVPYTNAQQEKIDEDLRKVRETTVDDLIQKRNDLLNLTSQISNVFGAGDSEYSKIYNKPDPSPRIQKMTIDEFDILNKMYDLIQSLDSLTATNQLDQERTQSAFEYVGGLANISEIPFENSTAKIRLPVPFGLNMEQIAARYLGNPDRWIEIATLNGLRSPYIDEDGFFYNLLSNADGRQFNVSTNANLYVGQKIVLSNLTQPPTTRRITNIEKINSSNYLITVDGLDNLDVYTTATSAKMRAYLPGTVNSQDQIYVPSDLAETDTFLTRPVPATKGDPLVGLSKVDWLLTDSGDIAIDAYGDFRLSFGITNLIQALKMKFATPPDRLLKHPGYGAGLTPGVSNADLNDSDTITRIINSINQDPRYGEIVSLVIERKGPIYSVSLSVTLANGTGVFPISFVLNN